MLISSPEQPAETVVHSQVQQDVAWLAVSPSLPEAVSGLEASDPAGENSHQQPIPVGADASPDAAPTVAKVLDQAAEQIDWQQAAREALAQAVHLPPAVKAHFTRSIEDTTAAIRDALGRPLIPISEAITALSSAIPLNWLQDPNSLQQAAHPHGDGYFEGVVGLTSERAAQIAQQQLAASGFAKRA